MQRFKRIAHRGWLRRFLSVATFGYYPLVDGAGYIVSGDVNIRITASYVEFAPSTMGNASIRLATSADSVEL